MHGFDWGFHDTGGLMSGGILMIITWLIVIAMFVILVVWITRHSQQLQQSQPTQTGQGNLSTEVMRDDPLEILKIRYARGEIDRAEYEEKVNDLGG